MSSFSLLLSANFERVVVIVDVILFLSSQDLSSRPVEEAAAAAKSSQSRLVVRTRFGRQDSLKRQVRRIEIARQSNQSWFGSFETVLSKVDPAIGRASLRES